ncbi:MAG: coenzyme F420-0:L-glutamate ligase, partial [Polyangiales bacterium]
MTEREPATADFQVGSELVVRAIAGVPTVEPGDDLYDIVVAALSRAEIDLRDGDVIVLASKVVSRAEDCFVDLGTIEPGDTALTLGQELDKDPRLVELILRESV